MRDQNGVHIRLPMSLQARFVPLQDTCEYFIHEVIQMFKMPIQVEFTDTKIGESATASTVFNSFLGALTLKEVLKEETIVCSTKDQLTEKRYVIAIPRSMDITVVAARGATSEDKYYMSLCRILNDGVELPKLETLEYENVYASRTEAREYMQLQLLNFESHVYAKRVAPRPLPRNTKDGELSLFQKTPGNKMKEDDFDECTYERMSLRSPPIKEQQLTCSNENQNQDIPQATSTVAPKAKISELKIENNTPNNNKESEANLKTKSKDSSPILTLPTPEQSATDTPVCQSMTLPNC